MENQGYGDLRLEVIPGADWITVNRSRWTIKGGRKARLRLTVALDTAPPGESGTVEIRTAEKTAHLTIHVDEG